MVAVEGFGGMRDQGETLAFAPRLPSRLTRLAFRLVFRDRLLRVEIRSKDASYELLEGEPIEILHHGDPLTVRPGVTETRACEPQRGESRADPPAGRKPPRRHEEA